MSKVVISDSEGEILITLEPWEEVSGYLHISASESGEEPTLWDFPTMSKGMWERFKRAGDFVFEMEEGV
tara:strand:+ start:36728 stop:36934 length:207 start_codon:yes stop_codon:yes gene_type:complete